MWNLIPDCVYFRVALIVIEEKIITSYGRKNAQAREALKVWFAQVQLCNWSSHNDLLVDFATADYIGQGRYVFDIKGNHYRLVAQVLFSLKTGDIRRIMTHADYSKLIDILPGLKARGFL